MPKDGGKVRCRLTRRPQLRLSKLPQRCAIVSPGVHLLGVLTWTRGAICQIKISLYV